MRTMRDTALARLYRNKVAHIILRTIPEAPVLTSVARHQGPSCEVIVKISPIENGSCVEPSPAKDAIASAVIPDPELGLVISAHVFA